MWSLSGAFCLWYPEIHPRRANHAKAWGERVRVLVRPTNPVLGFRGRVGRPVQDSRTAEDVGYRYVRLFLWWWSCVNTSLTESNACRASGRSPFVPRFGGYTAAGGPVLKRVD